MVKRDKGASVVKSALDDGRPKTDIELLETVQGIAASGTLDAALEAAGIPVLPRTETEQVAERFSKLAPFDRSKFDYEKYCTELTADLMDTKRTKD